MKDKKNLAIIVLVLVSIVLVGVVAIISIRNRNAEQDKSVTASLLETTENTVVDLYFVDPEDYFAGKCMNLSRSNNNAGFEQISFFLSSDSIDDITKYAREIKQLNSTIALQETEMKEYFPELYHSNGLYGIYQDNFSGPAVENRDDGRRAFVILWDYALGSSDLYDVIVRYPYDVILEKREMPSGSNNADVEITTQAAVKDSSSEAASELVVATSFPDGSFPDPECYFGSDYLGQKDKDDDSCYYNFNLPDRDASVFEEYVKLFSDDRFYFRTEKDNNWTFTSNGKKFTAYDVFYTGNKPITTFDNVYRDGLALTLSLTEDGSFATVSVHYSEELTPVDVGVYSKYATRTVSQTTESQKSSTGGSRTDSQSGDSMCLTCHGLGKITSICSVCHGSGNGLSCFTCHGKGSVDCTSCGGKGYTYNLTTDSQIKCYACNGGGYKECNACRGSGTRTCTNCNGNGKTEQECTACRGSGRN